jgi:DNA polymerase
MQTLGIDIETYSSTDLTKSGVYKYVEAPDFEVLMFAYSVDDRPVQIIDLAQGEHLPEKY